MFTIRAAAERHSRGGGIRATVFAAFFFSVMSLLVKLIGGEVPVAQIVFVRGLFALGFTYWLLRQTRVAVWGTKRPLLWVRGLLGTGSLTCFYYALVHLPLAEATVIQFTNPLWTLPLAAIFLGERLSSRALAVGVMCLIAVILIARPGILFGAEAADFSPVVLTVALGGAIFAAAAAITVRRLSETDTSVVIVFYFALVTMLASAPFVVLDGVRATPIEWLLMLAVGASGLAGQLYLTRGLRLEPAGRVASIGYLQIVFVGIWGLMFFAEIPDGWTIVGACLILFSLVLTRRHPLRVFLRFTRREEHTASV
jgi:drug/metabolite transporter (DMT)-like permease